MAVEGAFCPVLKKKDKNKEEGGRGKKRVVWKQLGVREEEGMGLLCLNTKTEQVSTSVSPLRPGRLRGE